MSLLKCFLHRKKVKIPFNIFKIKYLLKHCHLIKKENSKNIDILMNVMSNLNSNNFANNFDFLNVNDNFEYPANIRENSIKITKHQNINKNNSNNGNILNLAAKFGNLKLSDPTSKQNTKTNNTKTKNTRKSNINNLTNNENHNSNVSINILNLVSKFDRLKIYDKKKKKSTIQPSKTMKKHRKINPKINYQHSSNSTKTKYLKFPYKKWEGENKGIFLHTLKRQKR